VNAALTNALLVGSGGFVGAICRYALGGLIQRNWTILLLPSGTLVVNLLGCLLIGLVVGLIDSRGMFGPGARLFLLAGLLGGFTTFSTFGYDTLTLIRNADILRASMYVLIHVVAGVALVWAGYSLASR